MCNLNEDFKLCSCDGDKLPLAEIDWVLERKNEQLAIQHLRGKAARNVITGHKKHIKSLIAEQLNDRNCFDFDYIPHEDDLLKIKTTEKGPIRWYTYRFRAGQWKEDESTILSSWRTQLEYYKNGKNYKNINELFEETAKSMLEEKD